MNQVNCDIIVLAGGQSSRFAPFKDKNLFPFNGKPLIAHQIKMIKKYVGGKIILVANEESYPLYSELAEKEALDISIVIQTRPGQSGAVHAGLTLNSTTSVLVINGNDLFEDTLWDSFNQFYTKNQNIRGSLVGKVVETYFPGGYLVLKEKDNAELVVEVQEKPGAGNEPSNVVRLVFDFFPNTQQLKYMLETTTSENDDVYEKAITNLIAAGTEFELIRYSGLWNTIKFSWHVLGMQQFFLNQLTETFIDPSAQIDPSAKIKGNVYIGKNVKVFEGAVISGPCYIGDDCIIGNSAMVRQSTLGKKCVVGFMTEVARSYLSENVWLHTNYIGDSIIGNNVSFGSGAITTNLRLDKKTVMSNVKGNAIDTGLEKLGAIVGDSAQIGSQSAIMPGRKIGAGAIVGPGVMLNQDVESFEKIVLKQELVKSSLDSEANRTVSDTFRAKL